MDYKKYGNAKSISSDAYFGGGSAQEDKVRSLLFTDSLYILSENCPRQMHC